MSQLADYISIGEFILMDSSKSNIVELEKIGEEFTKYCNSRNPRKLYKDMRFGEYVWPILMFARWQGLSTRKLWVRTNDVQYSLQWYQNGKLNSDTMIPMCILEMLGIVDGFVVLDDFESRSPGAGKAAMEKLLDERSTETILLQAGYLYHGDFERSQMLENTEVLDNLVRFYLDLGFIIINDVVGGYTNSTVMLHAAECVYKLVSGRRKMNDRKAAGSCTENA